MNSITNIYVASSCQNNGTVSAKATICICTDSEAINPMIEIVKDSTITNQKVDLLAIKFALNNFKDLKIINIHSRSEYAVKCVTVWADRWKNNNWLSVSKKSIKNESIIREVVEIIDLLTNEGASINITFIKKDSKDYNILRAQSIASSALNAN